MYLKTCDLGPVGRLRPVDNPVPALWSFHRGANWPIVISVAKHKNSLIRKCEHLVPYHFFIKCIPSKKKKKVVAHCLWVSRPPSLATTTAVVEEALKVRIPHGTALRWYVFKLIQEMLIEFRIFFPSTYKGRQSEHMNRKSMKNCNLINN